MHKKFDYKRHSHWNPYSEPSLLIKTILTKLKPQKNNSKKKRRGRKPGWRKNKSSVPSKNKNDVAVAGKAPSLHVLNDLDAQKMVNIHNDNSLVNQHSHIIAFQIFV